MDIAERPDNQSRPSPYIDKRWQAVELTVVVPTFNKHDNVNALLRRLEAALGLIGAVWNYAASAFFTWK
jgi:hypothetical protein